MTIFEDSSLTPPGRAVAPGGLLASLVRLGGTWRSGAVARHRGRPAPAAIGEAAAGIGPRCAERAWRAAAWTPATEAPDGARVHAAGARLVQGLRLFHDAHVAEIAVSAGALTDRPSRGLVLQAHVFDGSYLSLAQDLPDSLATETNKRHIIGAEAPVHVSQGVAIYYRLNIAHGPNVARLVCARDARAPEAPAEFDLAAVDGDLPRIDRLWLDIIVENPGKRPIAIADLAVYRRHRALF